MLRRRLYTNQHRDQYFKNDKWVFDDKLLGEALKNQNRDFVMWAKDAQGRTVPVCPGGKLLKPARIARCNSSSTTSSFPAGPDRKLGTKDDLKLGDIQKFQQFGGGRLCVPG